MKDKGGRPTKYTEELAVKILAEMTAGRSLRSICEADDMPNRSTVMLWAAEDREGFSSRYEAAYLARALYWADELLDIADDSTNDYMEKVGENGETGDYVVKPENIQRSRLRVDSRKWLLSKLVPKFADKQQLDHTSSDGSMSPEKLDDAELDKKIEEKLKAIRDASS